MREPAELDHRSDQSLDLRRSARFDVLQHRRLVPAYFLGTGDTLFQAYAKRDAQFVSDRLGLGHHRRRKLARRRILANVQQRGTGERADGIEGQVAPELEPDLGADVV